MPRRPHRPTLVIIGTILLGVVLCRRFALAGPPASPAATIYDLVWIAVGAGLVLVGIFVPVKGKKSG